MRSYLHVLILLAPTVPLSLSVSSDLSDPSHHRPELTSANDSSTPLSRQGLVRIHHHHPETTAFRGPVREKLIVMSKMVIQVMRVIRVVRVIRLGEIAWSVDEAFRHVSSVPTGHIRVIRVITGVVKRRGMRKILGRVIRVVSVLPMLLTLYGERERGTIRVIRVIREG